MNISDQLEEVPLFDNYQLENTFFYQWIQSTKELKQIFNSSIENQKIICIPPNDEVKCALRITKYSKNFIMFLKDHILSNSPFFVGHYVTEKGNVLIEEEQLNNNKKIFITGNGFQTKNVKVEVLHEEICYNNDYKSYRILFIDKCLIDEYQMIKTTLQNSNRRMSVRSKIENNNHLSSLNSLSAVNMIEIHKCLNNYNETSYDKLKLLIQTFNHNYLLLKNYYDYIIEKINEESITACELFDTNGDLTIIKINNEMLNEFNGELELQLKNMINCTFFDGIYDKIFPFLESVNLQKDFDFYIQCVSINNYYCKENNEHSIDNQLFDLLQIPKSLQCNQLNSINYLSENLNKERTIYGKLKIIKTTKNLIFENITKKNKANENIITTDELIPLFSYILIKSKIKNFMTNYTFLENFLLKEFSYLEFGFLVSSLFAAIQFIKEEFTKNETLYCNVNIKKEIENSFYNQPLELTNNQLRKHFSMSAINQNDRLSISQPNFSSLSNSPRVDSINNSPLVVNNLLESSLENNNNSPMKPKEEDDQPKTITSPRDRNIVLRQRREEEKQKRNTLKRMESLQIFKEFEQRLENEAFKNFNQKK
ncbi:hypothetical protein ABK040_012974 [Willaertia magna]